MRKPTYYLWRSDFSSQEKFEAECKKYTDSGFRVVTFLDGNSDADIHNGIKAMVRNQIVSILEYQTDEFPEYKFLRDQDILIISFDF